MNYKDLTIKIIVTVVLFFTINAINAQNSDSLRVKKFIEQGDKYRIEGEFEKAREYALKALELKPNYGLAYILIGSIYVSSAELCGEEYLLKAIVYCLAVDMFEKAKEVDKSVSETADKFIEVYSRYFPSQEDIFGGPREGDKFKIECWINRETTVRYRR
ncbi:MAG: hypothetical protein A2W99_16015 [Bacteroidetes bacterium GWF2_33_16]|nr:MAG: hypothetical protein A2X00_15360 [Bacteroidetes bacterium GWE2_32_14]OFY02407.1 MAG: hypothetical protein A2W99_16015 [Bacteroidetes bacterium GWF2_33_16]